MAARKTTQKMYRQSESLRTLEAVVLVSVSANATMINKAVSTFAICSTVERISRTLRR